MPGCTLSPPAYIPHITTPTRWLYLPHTTGDSSSICTTCICALVDVFTPALVAGGVTVNSTDPSSFPLDQSASIIRQCAEQYLVSMLQANVNVTALSSLSECAFESPSSVPPCLAQQVADIRPGANNTAFNPETAKNGTGEH